MSIDGFGVAVTICRSAGGDGAVVVFIESSFEPDKSPGMRVLVNDGAPYTGVAYRRPTPSHHVDNGEKMWKRMC